MVDGDRLQYLDNDLVTAGREQLRAHQPVTGRVEEQRTLPDQGFQADFIEGGIAGTYGGGQATVDLCVVALLVVTVEHLVGHMLPLRIADGLQGNAVILSRAGFAGHTAILLQWLWGYAVPLLMPKSNLFYCAGMGEREHASDGLVGEG